MQNNSLKNQFIVSVFNHIWDTENDDHRKDYDAAFILDIIKTGDHGVAQNINAIRNAVSKEDRDRLKQKLQVVMWQGIFTQRNNNGCKSLSSLVCIDIDHQTEPELEHIRQIIKTWPFVLAFFMSPSGDGLKVLVRTDNLSIDDYGNCYRQVEKLFTDEFGIQPDSSCEDLSHTCFISYDPNMYCNPNSQPWHYEYDSTFDKPKPSLYSGSSSHSRYGNPDKPYLTVEGFIAEMNRMRCTLTDEQIITILDIRWSKFPNNYQDGNRTKSVFIQASALCKAGIDMDKALEYLKSKFLPTGFDEGKLGREVYQAYEKNNQLYGSERSNYRSYDEYKLGH